VPIPQATIDQWLEQDIDAAEELLNSNFAQWTGFANAPQQALMNLCFNMGWGDGTHGLSSFKKMLAAMTAGDWNCAAADLLASRYAQQVGKRAQRVAALIRQGSPPAVAQAKDPASRV
jgi:lysozyme